MYLARTEPLGPHRKAIRHILRAGGDKQLFTRSRFALWCVAVHRLQYRQILLREEPDPDQIAWMSKLNIDRPDIHLTVDVTHMNILSAAANTLIQSIEDSGAESSERIEKSRQLAHESHGLITSIEKWTSGMAGVLKTESTNPQHIAQPQEMGDSSNPPIPHFPYPRVLSYYDISLAYMWNCHGASQIVFRESWSTSSTTEQR